MLAENAIVRVLAHHAVIDHYGAEKAQKIKERMLCAHPLDEEKDAPLPQWAVQILKDPSVGYRTRIRIAMTHHWDITGENPSWRFVQPSDMKNSPPKPPPSWLQAHRAKKIEIAKKYLEKTKTKEGK